MLQIHLIKDMGGKSTPHMVEVSNKEDNDGHQATSPIQMEFDVDNQTEDTLKNHQVMKDVSELQSPNLNSHHTDETCEHSKDASSAQTHHHLFEGTMNEDTWESTPSGSISPDTREAMNTFIVDLGTLPIHAIQQELTENQSLLSDCQLPIDIPITDIVVQSEINTPHARIRMPSRNCKSPYLTSFGSSEKGKVVMTDVIHPNFPFQGCEITNQAPSYLIDEFIEWVTTGLLKAHSKKKPSEDNTNQEHLHWVLK